MNNKKSLLQDSLQELENIKNESLELAKEQLINESADLLEKKSAALFEKLIGGDKEEEEDKKEEKESDNKKSSKKEKEEEEENDDKKSSKDESTSINEMLNELKDLDDEDDSDDIEMDSDDMESDEEEMSLDALRKAAEEHGFKLVADSDDEEGEEDEEEMDSDEEEMDSDEEEIEDSDDEEDIEFDDSDEFSDVDVDDRVLAEPSDDDEEEEDINDEEEEESFKKINENFKRNNTKMRNTKKQVLKDLRDVSFNKLVEAYYNMNENDSFIIKENKYMEDEDYGMENEGYGMEGGDYVSMMDEDLYEDENYEEGYHSLMDEDNYDEGYGMEDEDVIYEIDMPSQSMSDENWNMEEELSETELNEMLAEMDVDFSQPPVSRKDRRIVDNVREVSGIENLEPKFSRKNPSMSNSPTELEEMFETMTLEELHEMEKLLHEDGDVESTQDGEGGLGGSREHMRMPVDIGEDYMEKKDLTEAEIEEMLAEMQGDELEESSAINSQTKMNRGNRGGGNVQGRPERRSGMISEEETEEVESLHEQIKKLKAENKSLNEGFTNKVKSLENKVYDVTISALKAGFVNKFLLEHPLRENEKLQIIHRFTNAQTKEQIKETYISLTNEFAKGQTVKDGSMLNESVQNKVGKVHRTDNVVVTEKNLMNENDESNRFKQLLNYNFGKRK
jgi:hypothetical protein